MYTWQLELYLCLYVCVNVEKGSFILWGFSSKFKGLVKREVTPKVKQLFHGGFLNVQKKGKKKKNIFLCSHNWTKIFFFQINSVFIKQIIIFCGNLWHEAIVWLQSRKKKKKGKRRKCCIYNCGIWSK